MLPPKIASSLEECITSEAGSTPSDDQIAAILVSAIATVDDSIRHGLLDLFPGGEEQLAALSDAEIEEIIRPRVLLARTVRCSKAHKGRVLIGFWRCR